MTEVKIFFLIIFTLAVVESVLKLAFVPWYFLNGIRLFTYTVRTSVSGEIPVLKKVENMLRKDSFAPYLKFELINS